MKKIILQVLQYTVFLGLAAVLLYFSLRNIDFSILAERIKTAKYLYIILALAIGFMALYVRAYRWNIIIEPLGYKPNINNTYHALSIGYMSNYAFPRLGEVTRCGVLNRTEKIPADVLIGTVIAERLFDMLALIILTIAVVFMNFKFFGAFFSDKVCHPIYVKISSLISNSYIAGLIVIGAFILLLVLIYVFRENILKITLVRKVGKVTKGILKGIRIIFEIKRKTAFFVSPLLLWAIYWIVTYLLFLSLQPTSNLTMLDALFILVAGSYGMAAPVQAGIGAFHAMVALSLSIYSISWSDGIAYAIISHGSQAIGLIILGLISLLILFFRKRHAKIQANKLNLNNDYTGTN